MPDEGYTGATKPQQNLQESNGLENHNLKRQRHESVWATSDFDYGFGFGFGFSLGLPHPLVEFQSHQFCQSLFESHDHWGFLRDDVSLQMQYYFENSHEIAFFDFAGKNYISGE